LHFTPTYSSLLNLIERWFKELNDKRLRRGVFTSVADLTAAITEWAEHWTTARSRSYGKPPRNRSSPKSGADGKVRRGRDTLHRIKAQTDH
jgi:hypothetical protein